MEERLIHLEKENELLRAQLAPKGVIGYVVVREAKPFSTVILDTKIQNGEYLIIKRDL